MCFRVELVSFSFSLSAHFWLSVKLKEDLDDDKEVRMLRTFFLCSRFVTQYSILLLAERGYGGGGGVSLSLERAYV